MGKLIIGYQQPYRKKVCIMKVKVYENAETYLADNETVLLENETVSQLVLYNAYLSRQGDGNDGILLGVVKDNDKIILHFSNIPDANLAVYVQNSEGDIREAAKVLAYYMADNRISMGGINAKQEVCEAFIDEYRKKVKCTFVERMAVDIMEIRQVNEIRPAEGRTRLALPHEVKMLTDWLIQFQIEALAKEIDYESALNKISRMIDNNRLYVFEDNKENAVSMAAATRNLAHGIAISYVYTPEEYRGFGYAATNIYNISKKYLDEGYEFCTLFVDKKNMISRRAYEKVGYRMIDEMYEYKLLQV